MFEEDDLSHIPGIDEVLAAFNSSDSGYKQVYACRVQGEKNAIKVTKVADRGGINDTMIQRLRRELELLGSLHSPYLPKLGDLPVQRYDKNGAVFIVYSEKFIEGADVCELNQTGSLIEAAKIRKLLHDVGTAIQIYWGQRTIHRDVKPANIRYCNDTSNYILIDAGIALIRDRTTITPTGHNSPMTPLYAAPEILRGERSLSYRTDLFCLGVVAYECAAQSHPFYAAGMSKAELENAILNLEPQDLSVLRPDLSSELTNLIMKMMRKRPHQRPSQFDKIINAEDS